MPQRLICSTHPPPLADRQCYSLSKGRADIVVAQAARVMWLHQWINGVVPDGAEQVAPFTGMGGGTGHDHSGGVMGRPIRHTVWSCTFGKGPTASANITGGQAPRTKVTSGDPSPTIVGTPHDIFNGDIKTVFVPMCGPDGVYFALELSLTIELSDDAIVGVDIRGYGGRINFTKTYASGGVKTLNSLTDPSSAQVLPMRPGWPQKISGRIWLENNGVDAEGALLEMGLHQYRDDTGP